MRNRLSKTLPLAIALLLAVSGAALAGDNAGATLSITSPVEISGVGANAPVTISLSAAGMVNVKQFDVTLEITPASAFNLSSSSFAQNAALFAISPGVEYPAGATGNQVKSGAASFGAAANGTGALGTFTLNTSATFTSATTATIKVVRFSLGPTSTNRDVFTTTLTQTVTLNPPAPAPTIASIAPVSGLIAGGTAVTITGANFAAGATVKIGGVAATNVVVASGTSITAVTPAGAVGAVDVVVTNADAQAATLTGGFTYVRPPAPVVTAVAPNSGVSTGGTSIAISGANFVAGATVTIGGAAATNVVVVSATSITATSPAGAEGAADVVVRNADGQTATVTGGFTFVAIIEPALNATSARDLSKGYSAVGEAQTLNGSLGEAVFSVRFNSNTGAAAAGQSVSWAITNNGSEPVYRLSTGAAAEIAAGATVNVTTATGAGGIASITLDAAGAKTAGTTSVSVVATTTANTSVGSARNLRVAFAATWDVPVAAELSSFAGGVLSGDTVRLQWTAASQTANLGWQVYRSTDNVSFAPVGDLVAGDGTVDASRSYEFVDQNAPTAGTLYYYLLQVNLDGSSTQSQTIQVALSPTGIAATVIPTATALRQNFPNPFNPETSISFDLAEAGVVSVSVYDAAGQLVRNLVAGQSFQAGRHEVTWNGQNNAGERVASGVYLYQLEVGTVSQLRRMTLLQ